MDKNKRQMKYRFGPLACVLITSLMLISNSSLAFAESLTKTYADGQEIPTTIEEGPHTYKLQSWSKSGGANPQSKTFTFTDTKTLSAEEFTGEARDAFPQTHEIDEEGYKGEIPLIEASARVSEEKEVGEIQTLTKTFSYLSQAELDAYPESIEDNGKLYTRTEFTFNRMPSDINTFIYEGSATYTFDNRSTEPKTYALIATYEGSLSITGSVAVIQATYTSDESASSVVIDDPTPVVVSSEKDPINLIDVAIWSLAAIAAVMIGVYAGIRTRRFEVTKRAEEAHLLPEDDDPIPKLRMKNPFQINKQSDVTSNKEGGYHE